MEVLSSNIICLLLQRATFNICDLSKLMGIFHSCPHFRYSLRVSHFQTVTQRTNSSSLESNTTSVIVLLPCCCSFTPVSDPNNEKNFDPIKLDKKQTNIFILITTTSKFSPATFLMRRDLPGTVNWFNGTANRLSKNKQLFILMKQYNGYSDTWEEATVCSDLIILGNKPMGSVNNLTACNRFRAGFCLSMSGHCQPLGCFLLCAWGMEAASTLYKDGYLTLHDTIFRGKDGNDPLKSLPCPILSISRFVVFYTSKKQTDKYRQVFVVLSILLLIVLAHFQMEKWAG